MSDPRLPQHLHGHTHIIKTRDHWPVQGRLNRRLVAPLEKRRLESKWPSHFSGWMPSTVSVSFLKGKRGRAKGLPQNSFIRTLIPLMRTELRVGSTQPPEQELNFRYHPHHSDSTLSFFFFWYMYFVHILPMFVCLFLYYFTANTIVI